MNLDEQIVRHQVAETWVPDPFAHMRNPRDAFHAEWAAKKLRPISPASVLDVGCYDGWLAFILLWGRSDLFITGLELIPNLCESARMYRDRMRERNFVILEGSLLETDIAGGLNAVICFEVLEHIPLDEVPAWLSKMEDLSHPGALILLSLPDQRHEDNPQHLWTPTRSVIDDLLRHKKGVTVEYKSYPGTTIPGNFLISYFA